MSEPAGVDDPRVDAAVAGAEEVDADAPGDRPTACAHTEYREGEPTEDLPATGAGAEGLDAAVWDALYGVEDPEMPISIVDLGLVYGVDVDEGDDGAAVTVEMTLTYTGCPARTMLLNDVETAVESVEGVERAAVRLVWSPEWTVELVTEAGRDDLREFGVSI